MSACVSNPVDVKKQTDKISINTNISSTQSDKFSDDYILGKVIFESPILSSILIDGGNTTIKFDGKRLIRSDESEQTEYSDKVEKQEYTKKQFSEKYTNQSNTPKTVIDKKYIKNAKLIKEVKYYKGDSFVSIIYFDNKPALYISDGIRTYEIMPNSKGFDNAVSNEILKHISPNFDYDKYKSEAHYIYQKEYTGDNTISVYLNFYAATYSTRYGYVKDESGWVCDARIDLKLGNNSNYSVVKFTAAQDGSEYNKSIKEMFSNDVYAYYFGDNSNNKDSFSDELKKHARDLKKQNKLDYDFKLQYPYTYLYLTEYAK